MGKKEWEKAEDSPAAAGCPESSAGRASKSQARPNFAALARPLACGGPS